MKTNLLIVGIENWNIIEKTLQFLDFLALI